ncbi:hypothetical protein KSB_44850 [Ktedonobacter robiniae]|uniref:Uncharacterized protein n=1 Tax=Ktedonobacter robiniae TaxID=2778365 RepID=A0ABQ3UTN4_9CHLR|nr:hypothetical protein KSB_44850 [Ktedonobacter robiniae]
MDLATYTLLDRVAAQPLHQSPRYATLAEGEGEMNVSPQALWEQDFQEKRMSLNYRVAKHRKKHTLGN